MPDRARPAWLAELSQLYPDIDAGFLESAASDFEPVSIAGGHTLVRRGDPSDALYLLLSGRLAATMPDDKGGVLRLGEIGRGEMIGEMSVLAGGVRTATVTALRDSRLMRISNEAFLGFMQRHPSVTRQFIRVLMERLRQRPGARREHLSTVALLPASAAVDAAGLGHALRAQLRADTPALLLDMETARARFPGDFDTASDEQIALWLNDLEQHHSLLIYACAHRFDRWTGFCLRQADRVLLVARAADDSAPGEPERRFLAAEAAQADAALRGCELVLLHPRDAARPADTARWLAGRQLTRHHHLRDGHAGDVARLARHLQGRSVGLALGGGGAKAFAEIGVLRALERAGVPVDVIGGTSMGAVIGALAALGRDAAGVHEALRELVRLKPFSGVTVPVVSLLSGKRLARAMRMLLGEGSIEDLWRRYFCVSCSLTRGAVEISHSGPLAHWVTASNAVPGVVPPVIHEGELYVDGGLLNNVPADALAAINPGPVIAVNVSSETTLRAGVPDEADLSGWRLLFEGFAPGDEGSRVPRLGRILVRSMLLASANHAAAMREHASLYLAPPLGGLDVSDWQAIDQLVEAGYRHASEQLESWEGLERARA